MPLGVDCAALGGLALGLPEPYRCYSDAEAVAVFQERRRGTMLSALSPLIHGARLAEVGPAPDSGGDSAMMQMSIMRSCTAEQVSWMGRVSRTGAACLPSTSPMSGRVD